MALVAIDCDGPLAHFTKAFCAGLTSRGFPRDPDTIKHWDLNKSITPEETAISDEVIGAPGYCAGLEWVEGAQDLVRSLRHWGHDVVCVTSPYPSPTWIPERSAWLGELFPGDDVLYVRSRRKPLIAADFLIEDHPGICNAWLEANPNGRAILVDRTWNQPASAEFWPHLRMYRVPSSRAVFELVRDLTT